MSPNRGFLCGECTGDTVYCTYAGLCEDDCIGRECGMSPNAGFLCGECAGDNVYCTNDGKCVLSWVIQAGGSGREVGFSISSLNDGSSLVTGNFEGSTLFGPGEINETVLASSGSRDVFVARYIQDGTLAWVVRSGGLGWDEGWGISSLPDGTSLIVGRFENVALFGSGEPNETELTSAGYEDIFVVRYNPDGTLAWATQAGGTSHDYGRSISSQSDGSSLVTGRFEGTALFGVGEVNETQLVSAGDKDIFIAQYNTNGTLAWARRAGGNSGDTGSDISVLSDGSSLVTGYFEGTSVFGSGDANETQLTSAGGWDVFVAMYNPDGTLAWVRQIQGPGSEVGNGISALPDGSFLVAGRFSLSAVFGTGETNETQLISVGGEDIFIARYSPDGALDWASRAGGADADYCYGNSTLSDGTSLITGRFHGSALFGEGEVNETQLTSAGGPDVFFALYNPDGTIAWARQSGGPGWDVGWGISSVPDDGTWLVTGEFGDTAVFELGEANENQMTALGEYDIFVMRLMP